MLRFCFQTFWCRINDEGEEVETEVLSGVIRTEVTVESDGENEFALKFSSSEIEEVSDE